MIEADINVFKHQAKLYYVQLAVLLITHCSSHQWLSFVIIEETPLMLSPLDLRLDEWLPQVAFFVAIEKTLLTLPLLDSELVLILK